MKNYVSRSATSYARFVIISQNCLMFKCVVLQSTSNQFCEAETPLRSRQSMGTLQQPSAICMSLDSALSGGDDHHGCEKASKMPMCFSTYMPLNLADALMMRSHRC